jgi:cell wall-associated NlpC family hydrolase
MQKGTSYFLYAFTVIIVAFLLSNSCTHTDRPSGIPQKPPSHSPLNSIHFTIQVGAFSNMDNAVRLTEKLQTNGLNAYHFIDASNLYKVRFGNYTTKQAAQTMAESLRTRGLFSVYYIVIPQHIHAVSELRSQIVRTAKKYIGIPYKWGGESAREGFDCSGLTMAVYQLNGLDLPRTSRQQWKSGIPIRRHQLQEGDLVFFATSGGRRVTHVGIYAGENTFIHAPRRGKTIRITTLSKNYYRKRYVGARRYL